jgi:hypothetical protein
VAPLEWHLQKWRLQIWHLQIWHLQKSPLSGNDLSRIISMPHQKRHLQGGKPRFVSRFPVVVFLEYDTVKAKY